MNKYILIARIDELCKIKGVTRNVAFTESRVGKNFISNLNTSNPSEGKLTMLANYFGVSVEYLKGETDEKEAAIESNAIFLEQNNIYMIPVYESVSAGLGTIPQEYTIGHTPLYIQSRFEAAETMCIKVKGDSMTPKIEAGDIIQVHKQAVVDSGSLAVVLIDGDEVLVKKIEYGPNYTELQSFNPEYSTLRFNGAEQSKVKVIGLVKQIIKSALGNNNTKATSNDSSLSPAEQKIHDKMQQMSPEQLGELASFMDYLISKKK